MLVDESRDGRSEMYGLLLEFLQPSNDIIRNDDLCDIVVDFLEFGVDMTSALEVTRNELGYVVDASTTNAKELRDCMKGCLLGSHLELLTVYWCHASQYLKDEMLHFVWKKMQGEKSIASLLEHLICHGADVNAKFNGWTLLQYACVDDRDELIVKMLVSNGADVDARDYFQVCCFCVSVLK